METTTTTEQPQTPEFLQNLEGDSGALVGGVIAIVLLIALIKGVVRTFQRNWIAALLLLIFLFPLYIIWAFVEIFRSKPQERVYHVNMTKD